jgi:hypothetical protein
LLGKADRRVGLPEPATPARGDDARETILGVLRACHSSRLAVIAWETEFDLDSRIQSKRTLD